MGAFNGCTNLSITWYYNPITTASGFSNYLKTVIIPDSVTSIGQYAFSGCSGLTDITIPDRVTSIGSSAFSGCSGLTDITIPDRVTSINQFAFDGCSGLTSVTLKCSITSDNFSSSSSFPGDLRTKYFAADGGIGTYTTANPGSSATWTKQQ